MQYFYTHICADAHSSFGQQGDWDDDFVGIKPTKYTNVYCVWGHSGEVKELFRFTCASDSGSEKKLTNEQQIIQRLVEFSVIFQIKLNQFYLYIPKSQSHYLSGPYICTVNNILCL